MTVKKDIRKKNQPHSGVEGESPSRIAGLEGKATTESGYPPEVGGRGSTHRREPEGTRAPMIDTGWRSLIEKRESPRVDVRLPVTLRHNGKLIPATTENMSCGGMFLSSPTGEVTLGGNVEVILDLTEIERDVTLRGSVVRVDSQDSHKMAIQFVNLLAGGHNSLQRFLKKMQK